MAIKAIRNLDYIRDKDQRLYEALSDIIQRHENLTLQTNGNPAGEPHPPPSIDGVTVTGQNGHFHIQIQHRAEIYRGVQYYAEFADNAGFANPHTIHMGDSREHTQFLGNGTYYWRAYAAYAASPPSAPAYHGGAGRPQPVSGGGTVGGPALLAPQGSGTGIAGEGLSGPGRAPFRSTTGIPPKRGPSVTPGGSGLGAPLGPSPETGLPEGMGTGGGSGGGGGVTPSLTHSKIWIGDASNLPAEKSVSADATLADTGALTLATVNASPGTYGPAQLTVNAKGLVTAASTMAGFTGTAVLAALTGGGTQGSLTFVGGLCTAYVAPT